MIKIYALILIPFLFACNSEKVKEYPVFEEETAHLRVDVLKPFYHGVASGDPMQSSVVIWTRVTPETKIPEIEVQWEVASDSLFHEIVKKGDFITNPERDYTVKVIVEGLIAGTSYYYRFNALESTSLIGSTKTAPENPDEIRFAVVSCSNYQFGHFNAYGNIAKNKNIDAVIHLGDYIYEYGKGVYGDTTTGRFHLPENEIICLKDYRTRYAQYRLDPDLRAVHAQHPFITVWDDHEIANDSYTSGAQNHQEEEGSYEDRKNAAVQTYHEWMPVRMVTPLYRKFSFGNLADLIMLDERLEGRTAPPDSINAPGINDRTQRMLGEEQLSWLINQLTQSEAKWKVIGNQVIFSYLNWGYTNFNINLDSWDGYPYERNEIAEHIQNNGLKNTIFITGDTHSSWAFETTHNPFSNYNQATGEGAYAVEFGVMSVNSGNANERYPTDSVRAHEKTIVNTATNPHLKYANLRDHGYMILSLTDSLAQANWHFVKHMDRRSSEEKERMQVRVKAGNSNILEL